MFLDCLAESLRESRTWRAGFDGERREEGEGFFLNRLGEKAEGTVTSGRVLITLLLLTN